MEHRNRLNQLGNEVAQLEQSLRAYFRDIGETLLQENQNLPATKSAKEAISAAKKAGSSIKELDKRKDNLQKLDSKLHELSEKERSLTDQYTELDREMQSYYETIGRAAYELYAKSSEIGDQYQEMFAEVARTQNDLQEIQKELESAESELEKRPFLEKMVSRGKIALLKNRKSSKEAAQPRHFRSLGANVCNSDFIESVGDSNLQQTAKPFLDLKEKREKLDSEKARIDSEREKAESQIAELVGEQKNSNRALREIARQREEELAARDRALESIGREIDTANPPESVSELSSQAAQLQKQLEEKRELQKRLEAALEIQRIDGDLENKRHRYASLQQQIDDLKKRQKEINGEIKELEKKKQELEEVRGPEDQI